MNDPFKIWPCQSVGKPGNYSVAQAGRAPIFVEGAYHWPKAVAEAIAERFNRAERIKEAAVSGLVEYYTCLHDGTFVEEVKSGLKVPNTGNNQLDYENVRDQVEKAANAAEKNYTG